MGNRRLRDILVDDEGHNDDIVAVVTKAASGSGGASWLLQGIEELFGASPRSIFRSEFFSRHLSAYSKSRRKAPIYWHPKLAHEERRLESLTNELRDGATGAQRKALAAQEAVVEELRAFLEEVKRVAPLWKPNLDDGVIINFAPLWRLVPQNKLWQNELKATWHALCDGKYDWAQLAMHFWPERVVPKCAKDRSLAIAHGLEDVFWVEGTDGKWTPRNTPTESVDELVKDRTSTAVKFALQSLLEAPVASAKSTGRKGGARRKAVAAVGGGDA
jgi:hypothetical protein